jgi:undecaprenyl diphosphate synthase
MEGGFVMQSNGSNGDAPIASHVAIIMDGNGRWAEQRGLPRTAGHRAGADTVRRIVEAAPDLGVRTLTLYAFSSDNWRRPNREVRLLMRLFREYLRKERARCIENGVRVSVIGVRNRLPESVCREVEAMEAATREGRRLHLRLAVDYSARDAIVHAARRFDDQLGKSRECFARLLGEAIHARGPVPDVDLLVRTGGEQRLSDFLLWELAYAELWFTATPWPDYSIAEFAEAVREFGRRERRFGGLGRVAG